MKNTFGNALALTIFGESHGPAVGAVLDGMAAGVPVDEAALAALMAAGLLVLLLHTPLQNEDTRWIFAKPTVL